MHAEDPEATSLERQESLDAAFLEHLKESERRLSAARHSALDVFVAATIAVILLGGASLGIMRLRTTEPRDRSVVETSKPVSTRKELTEKLDQVKKERLLTEKEAEAPKVKNDNSGR